MIRELHAGSSIITESQVAEFVASVVSQLNDDANGVEPEELDLYSADRPSDQEVASIAYATDKVPPLGESLTLDISSRRAPLDYEMDFDGEAKRAPDSTEPTGFNLSDDVRSLMRSWEALPETLEALPESVMRLVSQVPLIAMSKSLHYGPAFSEEVSSNLKNKTPHPHPLTRAPSSTLTLTPTLAFTLT